MVTSVATSAPIPSATLPALPLAPVHNERAAEDPRLAGAGAAERSCQALLLPPKARRIDPAAVGALREKAPTLALSSSAARILTVLLADIMAAVRAFRPSAPAVLCPCACAFFGE